MRSATQNRRKHDTIGAASLRIAEIPQACTISRITHVVATPGTIRKFDRLQPDRSTALRPTDAITFVSLPQPVCFGDFDDERVGVLRREGTVLQDALGQRSGRNGLAAVCGARGQSRRERPYNEPRFHSLSPSCSRRPLGKVRVTQGQQYSCIARTER
jgi:hypothetical protein